MPQAYQIDVEAIRGHVRGKDGQLLRDPNGDLERTTPTFDINKPPVQPLEYREYPKVMYRIPRNLTQEAVSLKVNDRNEESQARKDGFVDQPHVIQPPCEAAKEIDDIEWYCELHTGHTGKHRSGRYLWADPLHEPEKEVR